jgi:drug/metabolite transporter (DMT)-like permease
MSWFLLAIIGHLANGVAFVIDKILLKSAFTRSATYAGIVGMLSFIVIFAAPFVDQWPTGTMAIVATVSGATFILALWAFFAALARAEASRVVPIVGSLIPILTLAGAFVFLGERLSDKNFIGFGLLILATIILSSGGRGKPSHDAVWLAVTSAFLFAIASVTAKALYDDVGFLGGFLTTRLAAAATALLIAFAIDRAAGQEILSIVRPRADHASSKQNKQPGRLSAILAIVGQTLGAIGFLFVQWAVSKGSASIVNSMQAVQYGLLVLVGLALHKHHPQLLGENVTGKTLWIKAFALVVTAVGMALIV